MRSLTVLMLILPGAVDSATLARRGENYITEAEASAGHARCAQPEARRRRRLLARRVETEAGHRRRLGAHGAQPEAGRGRRLLPFGVEAESGCRRRWRRRAANPEGRHAERLIGSLADAEAGNGG